MSPLFQRNRPIPPDRAIPGAAKDPRARTDARGVSWAVLAAVSLALPFLSACGKPEHPHDHGTAKALAPAKHEHHAPHDGTAVVLGDEIYHLELVLDAAAGKLQAYVLDGEMENFIRCPAPSFEVIATVNGEKRPLLFQAVADAATGEKVGDTALYETQADWLKSTPKFDAVLTALTVRGTPFTAVRFNFPLGNDHD